MAENAPELLIGADGWMHSRWEGTFYPDDLPEDWRLGYYANEFSVVVIEQKAWEYLRQNPDVMSEWMAETESGLQFVCEIPVDCSEQELIAYLSVVHKLNDACIGVILVTNTKKPDDFLVTAMLNQLPLDLPCVLDFTELPAPVILQQWQQQYSLSICWRAMPEVTEPLWDKDTIINKTIAIVRVPSDLFTLRQLRIVIEMACNKAGVDTKVLLIVEGEPPDVELMRNAQLIYDML